MNAADRRRRIEDLCHAALEQDPMARASFVATACGSDEALRGEVEALLAHAQTAEGFLSTPLGELAARALTDERDASLLGRSLGPYHIRAHLGSGGMGDVYRAHDTKLGREVAIKFLPHAFTRDPDRLARFEREARVLASLNHPHIGAIYGFEEADGLGGLVLELVEGETLADRLGRGPVPIAEALTIAGQIADALDAAHEKGVVHRDLKPANVKITPDGVVKVLDFGVAKRLDSIAPEGPTAVTATVASEAGLVLGTIAYMSPEQARGEPVDGRSDVFSLGAVLYELLAGRRAFSGKTSLQTLAAILGDPPPPIETIRRDVPSALAELVHDCLKKDRDVRPSARAVFDRLTRLGGSRTSIAMDLRRLKLRPAVLGTVLVVLLAGAVGLMRSWQSSSRVRWARNVAVPEIQRLTDQADYDGAYRLAREAMAVLPDDPQLKQIWINATLEVTFETNVSGADVALKGYRADTADWIAMGRTPLTNVRVPDGPLRVRITKEGMAPIESEGFALFKYTLDPLTALVPGMVRVGAATATVGTTSVPIKDFWIDKLEVTNRDFKRFVDQGGYRSREHWKEAFVDRGRTRSWEEAMTAFRDTTGRPGPSTWELGTYPEGQADFPVAGVSWYEAAAYAAFVGKRLPTAYHWRAAAGFNSPVEIFADIVLVSNFSGKGSAPVGSYRGLGPYGTYDMAGNVKEWCWSESAGGRRLILGAGWNETSYMFHEFDAQPPFQRSEVYGIRLMQEIEASVPEVTAPIRTLARDLTKEMPADAATFEIIRSLYAYDHTPLNATLEGVEEAAAWRKETVSYDAPYGKERIRTYLYLPRNASPPYQAVLYFPGGHATLLRSSRDLSLHYVDFVIRSGRALVYPVYKGTYERIVQVAGSNDVRDIAIARVKDAQRSIDYLITRPDIDRERLGYFGFSTGALLGVLVTAVEPRLKASVLLGGGILPDRYSLEIEPTNFAPRIRVPTLMVNGRSDFTFQYETSQVPLFTLLDLPGDRKAHVTLEGGHIPLRVRDVIRTILDWFDKFLGPVEV